VGVVTACLQAREEDFSGGRADGFGQHHQPGPERGPAGLSMTSTPVNDEPPRSSQVPDRPSGDQSFGRCPSHSQ
jgi:hypothetical protein